MLVSDLADTLLMLKASLHKLLPEVVDLILVGASGGEHFILGFGDKFALLADFFMQLLIL